MEWVVVSSSKDYTYKRFTGETPVKDKRVRAGAGEVKVQVTLHDSHLRQEGRRRLGEEKLQTTGRFWERTLSGLSQEAFPRGFPTGLSHVQTWWESILGVKVEAVQGKKVPLEWIETPGGFWERWHEF